MSHWIAPLVVLGVGAVLGLAWLIVSRVRGGGAAQTAGPALDAEQKLDEALEQLRELEEDKGKLAPARYASEKARLEGLAADAMRSRDGAAKAVPPSSGAGHAPAAASAPASAGLLAAHPELRGALWGGATVAFLGGLAALAYFNAAPRGDDEPITGGGAPGVMRAADADEKTPPRPADEVLADVMTLYDPDTLVARAHKALLADRGEEAGMLTDRALRLDPMNVEARIHSAALRGLHGEEKEALAELARILDGRREPEALLFRGVLAARAGDRKLAAESLNELRKVTPDGPAARELEKLVASLKEPKK